MRLVQAFLKSALELESRSASGKPAGRRKS
jgi:hypothetical protein